MTDEWTREELAALQLVTDTFGRCVEVGRPADGDRKAASETSRTASK